MLRFYRTYLLQAYPPSNLHRSPNVWFMGRLILHETGSIRLRKHFCITRDNEYAFELRFYCMHLLQKYPSSNLHRSTEHLVAI